MSESDRELDVVAKRWRKELRRRRRKKEKRRLDLRPEEGHRPYKSPILNLFSGGARGRGQKLSPKTFVAPSVFSISRNPAECIKFYQDIASYARDARRPRILLDQRRITYLGLGADSILGILLSEIKKELRHVYGCYIKGFKPKSRDIQKVMDEVGSVRALFMEAEEDIRLSFSSQAKVFRHRHRAVDEGGVSAVFDPSANAISDFSDHLDESLSIIGKRLSVDGRDSFCHYAAEVIDNVKEHSGLNEWAIVGYSDPDASVPTYRCVIFCFGRTIAETFQTLPEGSYPLRLIEPYLNSHRGGSFFTEDWREDDLITLISLQGDVSSKSVDDNSDRGQGTVELIKFFQNITDECGHRQLSAEMNIISGSTRIRFDGSYSIAFRPELNREIIAFNKTNDLMKRPDRSAIMHLKEGRFPGTLITIEVPLVGSILESEV